MLFCIRYSQNGYTLGLEREPGSPSCSGSPRGRGRLQCSLILGLGHLGCLELLPLGLILGHHELDLNNCIWRRWGGSSHREDEGREGANLKQQNVNTTEKPATKFKLC